MNRSCLLLLPLLAAPLAAQIVVQPLPRRGMMPSFQAGVVFDHDMSLIARKTVGLPGRLATFPEVGNVRANGVVPKYTVSAIMTWLQQQTAQTVLPILIDAMSSGNDLLPLFWVPAGGGQPGRWQIWQGNVASGWATLYVARIDDGATPDTGADIMGYYFDNPSFPSSLQGSVFVEMQRADWAQGTVSPPPAGANIAALDVAMGLIESNDGMREPGIIETVDKLFFSLTSQSAAQLANSGALQNSGPIDGGTIFVVDYNTQTGDVLSVGVHATAADLLLDDSGEGEVDIDALAMCLVRSPAVGHPTGTPLQGNTYCYIFSALQGQQPEELMVTAIPQNPLQGQGPKMKGPLRPSNDQVLIGPGPGSVLRGRAKGTCTQDPDGGQGARSFSVPQDVPWANPSMHLSMTAYAVDAADDSFTVTGVLSGWGTTGPGNYLPVLRIVSGGVTDYELLPLRIAGDDYYEFTVVLPGSVGVNSYDMDVLMTQYPYVMPITFEESIHTQFVR